MKKGSLSLSVNAIVILILAITMLGLGLGFIRGMFGGAQRQFEQLISQEPEPPTAYGSEPITLSREFILTQANNDEVVKISVYNSGSMDWIGITSGFVCSRLTREECGIESGKQLKQCTITGGTCQGTTSAPLEDVLCNELVTDEIMQDAEDDYPGNLCNKLFDNVQKCF